MARKKARKTSRKKTGEHLNDLRIVEELGRRKDKEGSWIQLARAINVANEQSEDATPLIDRRKLRDLVLAGEDQLTLSLGELRALNRYMELHGHSLSMVPFFKPRKLVESIALRGRVKCLLGAKPDKVQIYHSHWDVLGMTAIFRALRRTSPKIRTDLADVLLEAEPGSSDQRRWLSLLDGPKDDRAYDLLSVGSMRALPATEVMLARMLGVGEFTDAPLGAKRHLPFHFVWSPEVDFNHESHFRLSASELSELDPEAAKELSKDVEYSAIRTDKRTFIDKSWTTSKTKTYGVIVAQRRSGGQMWAVFAGITGPATYACGVALESVVASIPLSMDGKDSPVYWSVVAADVLRSVRKGRPKYSYAVSAAHEVVLMEPWQPT